MKKSKICFEFFAVYDVEGMTRHYEKMAAKGWLIEKVKGFFNVYRQTEPQQLSFEVIYIDSASDYIPADDNQKSFYEICEDCGWVLAAKNDKKHIFYSKSADSVPIETEVITQVENINRSYKEKMWQKPVLAFVMLMNLYSQFRLFMKNPEEAVKIGYHWIIFGMLLYIVAVLADFAGWKIWYVKAEKLRREENRLYSKSGRFVLWGYSVAFILMLCSLISMFSVAFICVVALSLLAAFTVHHFMTKLLGKATGDIKNNQMATVWLMLIVTVVVILLGIEFLGKLGIAIYR